MSTQNYANHTQVVPGFLALLLLASLTLVGSFVNLYQSWGDHQRLYSASLIVTLSIAVAGALFYGRTFALKVQDRAIRAEENLRHYVMAGKLLDPRLSPKQIVAVRFAGDAEFLALVKRAADESLEPKQIKQAVTNWRADHDRA